ncbi:MAG TPA: putative quinol monooxygenase [Planctomycetota bacterium]|nr:putative quinol monooxygenase [Planctomycetota bacterium]
MTSLMNLEFFRVRAGLRSGLGDALGALIEPTRQEAGCLSCNLYQSLDDPDVWLVFGDWRGQEYHDAHLKTLHVLAFLRAAPGLVQGDRDLRHFRIASPSPTDAGSSSTGND